MESLQVCAISPHGAKRLGRKLSSSLSLRLPVHKHRGRKACTRRVMKGSGNELERGIMKLRSLLRDLSLSLLGSKTLRSAMCNKAVRVWRVS
jgi:hypothetical protein